VSEQEFFFALDLSDEPPFDQMVGDLALAVMGQVGYEPAVTAELTDVLRTALAQRVAGGQRRCTVRFLAGGGQLQVIVDGAGGPQWRTSRPLPAS
jgi:hypothetical protein